MKNNKRIKELLNLNYLNLSNKTVSCGLMDLPAIQCNALDLPDYIALYSEESLYFKTNDAAVAFYEFDKTFDGKNGLYWAIYYNVKDRLEYFKLRFNNVKYIIEPDYSVLGDVHSIENVYRLFKARIVSLWFIHEIGTIVIPNISFPDDRYCDFAISGYEDSSVVSFSTKGHMDDPSENQRLRSNIRLTIDKLCNIKAIVVYDVCSTNDLVIDTFSYAVERGIKIVIPDNTLKCRNVILYRERHKDGKAVEV